MQVISGYVHEATIGMLANSPNTRCLAVIVSMMESRWAQQCVSPGCCVWGSHRVVWL
jgi:hypothetical protein